jgi:hypothetical protein
VRETQPVQHWASGAHRPVGETKDRLLELHYIVDRLRDVYNAEGTDIWLHGRNRTLNSEKPIDRLRGRRARIALPALSPPYGRRSLG